MTTSEYPLSPHPPRTRPSSVLIISRRKVFVYALHRPARVQTLCLSSLTTPGVLELLGYRLGTRAILRRSLDSAPDRLFYQLSRDGSLLSIVTPSLAATKLAVVSSNNEAPHPLARTLSVPKSPFFLIAPPSASLHYPHSAFPLRR